MKMPMTVAGLAALLIAGCSSSPAVTEGRFEPSCVAYEGDTVLLQDGNYTWDKYTDAIAVDEDGNVIDAFPHHPSVGRYELDGKRILLQAGGKIHAFLPLHHAGEDYLLTAAEVDEFAQRKSPPDCALRRAK